MRGNRCPFRIYFGRHPSRELPDLLRAVGLPHFSYSERSTIKRRIWSLLQDHRFMIKERTLLIIFHFYNR
nr:MAG TPA: hypothetical protein [Caudoviricetes sp.]